MNEYLSLLAIHPGEHLKEIIDSLEMTQTEFAKRLGILEKSLSDIVNEKVGITIETAVKLSKMFGNSVSFWINLQTNYDETLCRLHEDELFEVEKKMISSLDNKTLFDLLMDLEIVREYKKGEELVGILRQTFKVSNLTNIQNIYAPQFRQFSSVKKDHDFEISVWIQIAEIYAKRIEHKPYDKRKLNARLSRITDLNTERPEIFEPELKKLLAECGILLVIIPRFKGTEISGVTKKISRNGVMIALSLHGKSADKFWFALFHELYHAINLDGKSIFVCYDSYKDDEEKNADEFASQMLIHQNIINAMSF